MAVHMSLISPDVPLANYDQLRASSGDINLWEPEYGNPNLDIQLRRFAEIATSLDNSGIPYDNDSVIQTEQHLQKIFAEYTGQQEIEPGGSFAFIVPTRIQRTGSNKANYTSEVDPLFSLLKHADNNTKQVVMSGMPPFIVDRYNPGEDDTAGAIIFAPVLMDIYRDIPFDKVHSVTDKIMNQTTDFAKHTVGAGIGAFAAVLPRVIRYGDAIKTKDFYTTTGHGATTTLIDLNLEQAREMNLTRSQYSKIGILGTGAIGEATAQLLLHKNPTGEIILSDKKEERGKEVIGRLRTEFPQAKIEFTTNNAKVIEGCEVTICAAAAQFNIDEGGLENVDFTDTYIIDDSQPGAFSPKQVRERGGEIVWPVARDRTLGRLGTRQSFDYQRTGPAELDENFSCESEALVLSISKEYDKAIKAAVTVEQAIAIGSLMKECGVEIAPPQCLGQRIVLSS